MTLPSLYSEKVLFTFSSVSGIKPREKCSAWLKSPSLIDHIPEAFYKKLRESPAITKSKTIE